MWGVNANGNICKYTNDDANPWLQIPGAAVDIGAAADGTVWHVISAGDIYRYTRRPTRLSRATHTRQGFPGRTARGTLWLSRVASCSSCRS